MKSFRMDLSHVAVSAILFGCILYVYRNKIIEPFVLPYEGQKCQSGTAIGKKCGLRKNVVGSEKWGLCYPNEKGVPWCYPGLPEVDANNSKELVDTPPSPTIVTKTIATPPPSADQAKSVSLTTAPTPSAPSPPNDPAFTDEVRAFINPLLKDNKALTLNQIKLLASIKYESLSDTVSTDPKGGRAYMIIFKELHKPDLTSLRNMSLDKRYFFFPFFCAPAASAAPSSSAITFMPASSWINLRKGAGNPQKQPGFKPSPLGRRRLDAFFP